MLVWGREKGPRMKGKRYTTEDKIRILREPSPAALLLLPTCSEVTRTSERCPPGAEW